MGEEGYNGWSNYPTWAVNLWLSNDETICQNVCGLAATAREKASANEMPEGINVAPAMILGDMLREWYRPQVELGESSARSDLLGFALDLVDWPEVAEGFLEAGVGVV